LTDFMSYLPLLACVFALLSGALGLLQPTRVLEFVGLEACNTMGVVEARAMFGGIFIAMAVTCLLTDHPYCYLAFGMLWLGGAAGKIVGVVVDRPPLLTGIVSAGTDALVGFALVSGFY
jgi:hypothetical protein